MIHVGLGNFFRAHTAMYTAHAADADQWGIAAFTGRSFQTAETLNAQDDLYTLVVKNPEGNAYEVINSVSVALPGPDVAALCDLFASPEVVVVTSTVTEAAYHPDLAADLAVLREGRLTEVTTVPGKFVAGLLRRRAADAGPLSFVPCDNVPENGRMVEKAVRDLADQVDATLGAWIDANVGFVTTMVDRITPQVTAEIGEAVLADTGIEDPEAVATEPFTEWVLAGSFPGGRPAWETAGATFVDDIVPHELRKLWLLNGSHSLMAYAAPLVGRHTVYDAITDPVVADWVDAWWNVAAAHLPLPSGEIADYRAALVERFGNPRMQDALARIAADGSVKIPIRIVPALVAERAAGGTPVGAERAVAAWILHLRGYSSPVQDAQPDLVATLAAGTLEESVTKTCEYLAIDDLGARQSILVLAEDLLRLSDAR